MYVYIYMYIYYLSIYISLSLKKIHVFLYFRRHYDMEAVAVESVRDYMDNNSMMIIATGARPKLQKE